MEQGRRTLLVIDGQNLNGVIATLGLTKISYALLRKILSQRGRASIEMSRVYVSVHPQKQRPDADVETSAALSASTSSPVASPSSQEKGVAALEEAEENASLTLEELATEAIQEFIKSEEPPTPAATPTPGAARRTPTKAEGFFRALRHHGFVIRTVEIISRSDGSRKGDVDGMLIAETMELTIPPVFDQLILVAGDGDYEHMLRALRRRGIRTIVAFIPERTARNLQAACDEFIVITDILRECAEMQAENDRKREKSVSTCAQRNLTATTTITNEEITGPSPLDSDSNDG